jgi:MFS family permease
MKRLNLAELIYLNAYWVGLSFMWNSLHPIILPAVMLHLVPETLKNTYLGLMTFVGLIIAMIVQPVSGAISDRWRSRWGRRRPLILAGTLFDFIFLVLLGWSGGLTWVVIGYVGLQFSSNVAHGPAQGLLPDCVPEEQLGAASGIKNLMDMAGLVVASLAAGRLLDPASRYPIAAMTVIIAVLAVGLLITLFGTRETPSLEAAGPRTSQTSLADDLLRVDFSAHKPFWWLLASRFLFLIGVYGIQSFIQYYLQDVLAVENPAKQTGDLLAVITLALMGFVMLGGWLSDRWSDRGVLVVSGLMGAVGCLLLLSATTTTLLLIYGSVFGAGIGLFITANWTLANRLAPPDEAGKFMGLTNLATAGAGAVGRLEGPMIDILNNAQPGDFWGYKALFIIGAIGTLGSVLLLKWVGNGGIKTEEQGEL